MFGNTNLLLIRQEEEEAVGEGRERGREGKFVSHDCPSSLPSPSLSIQQGGRGVRNILGDEYTTATHLRSPAA